MTQVCNMVEVAKIYALLDPRDGEIRYIGRTVKALEVRLLQHLRDKGQREKRAEKRVTYRVYWVQSLKQQGVTPIIRLIQEVPVINMDEAEDYWTEYFRSLGCRLVNAKAKGPGKLGYKHDEEARAAISAGNKGKPKSPEHRAKLAAAQTGKKLSQETRDLMSKQRRGVLKTEEHKRKIGDKSRGRRLSAESRALISAARTGQKASKETKEALSAAKRGKKLPAEQIAKIADSNRGQKRSPETKARISEAARRREQRKRENRVL
jgi:hypothetical protein